MIKLFLLLKLACDVNKGFVCLPVETAMLSVSNDVL